MRPLRDLLLQLPLLPTTPTHEIDYAAADPDLLVQLAATAAAVMDTILRGMSAIGLLLAQAAPEVEGREMPADATEALGFLIAELGDLASVVHCLLAACRLYTADYVPAAVKTVPNVRF